MIGKDLVTDIGQYRQRIESFNEGVVAGDDKLDPNVHTTPLSEGVVTETKSHEGRSTRIGSVPKPNSLYAFTESGPILNWAEVRLDVVYERSHWIVTPNV